MTFIPIPLDFGAPRMARTASFVVFNPSGAHFSRVAASSRPSRSRMASGGVSSTSSSVLPWNISATIEEAAWLIVQPSPSNEMSSIWPSAPNFR